MSQTPRPRRSTVERLRQLPVRNRCACRACACAKLMRWISFDSQYKPTGDQPQAIAQLVEGVNAGREAQTLLGVTGSGKTFTIGKCHQRGKKSRL